MKKTLIILSLIAALIFGFLLARRTSPVFNFLFPPPDKFVPLATTEINLAKQGLKTELPFEPKYPGEHQVELEVQRYDLGAEFKGKFLLNVCIKNQRNRVVINRNVAGPISSFWGNEKKGFVLQSFNVPRQISLGENGTVEVTILTPDVDFKQTYGDAKLVVSKASDV